MEIRGKRPGHLSDALKEALGMAPAEGEGGPLPPPWLINMQRYGPPPSYPNLKIPGLNAPIPEGAQFGYQLGGWGKPPVDEFGNPLYGDVFGTAAAEDAANPYHERVDRSKHWGDLEEEEEEEEEEEGGEEDEEEGAEGAEPKADGEAAEEDLDSGIASISTVPSGLETPDVLDLRKQQAAGPARPLFQVLEERAVAVSQAAIMGSSHAYVVPPAAAPAAAAGTSAAAAAPAAAAARRPAGRAEAGEDAVAVTLRPEELEELDESTLAAKYARQLEEENAAAAPETFRDMVVSTAPPRLRVILLRVVGSVHLAQNDHVCRWSRPRGRSGSWPPKRRRRRPRRPRISNFKEPNSGAPSCCPVYVGPGWIASSCCEICSPKY